MKFLLTLLLISFTFSLPAQDFLSLTLASQIKGFSYISPNTEKTNKPIIYIHGIQETADRWKGFILASPPNLNHYAFNLPLHGIGPTITRLKGPNNYKSFYSQTLPIIIDHVYQTTGQKPILVGYSLGAKTIHDSLTKIPALRNKVEAIVELLRPNQLGISYRIPKSPLQIPKYILGLINHTPTMPEYELMRKTTAQFIPALPDGIYTHLEGTTMAQIENWVVKHQSTQVGNELNSDLLDDFHLSFTHTDHGLPLWFVWADNDLICPGGENAFDEMVSLRAKEYVLNHKGLVVDDVIKQVHERKFPKGFTPIYGTSLGNVGHIGAVIPGSQAAKVLGKGIHDFALNYNSFTTPRSVQFKVSKLNGIGGCAENFYQIINKFVFEIVADLKGEPRPPEEILCIDPNLK